VDLVNSWSARATRAALAIAVTTVVAVRLHAHHSGAMFDYDKSVTLAGTVKQFQWTNPHCWIELSVPGEKGAEDWSVEMGAPLQLYQGGWRPGTLKPGDEIKVVVRPPREGTTKAGLFVSATRGDGTVLGKAP
jgi:uncharacterized protein DUF6152